MEQRIPLKRGELVLALDETGRLTAAIAPIPGGLANVWGVPAVVRSDALRGLVTNPGERLILTEPIQVERRGRMVGVWHSGRGVGACQARTLAMALRNLARSTSCP